MDCYQAGGCAAPNYRFGMGHLLPENVSPWTAEVGSKEIGRCAAPNYRSGMGHLLPENVSLWTAEVGSKEIGRCAAPNYGFGMGHLLPEDVGPWTAEDVSPWIAEDVITWTAEVGSKEIDLGPPQQRTYICTLIPSVTPKERSMERYEVAQLFPLLRYDKPFRSEARFAQCTFETRTCTAIPLNYCPGIEAVSRVRLRFDGRVRRGR